MFKLNNSNTNWKYVLIAVIIAFLLGGGIWEYQDIVQKGFNLPQIETYKKESAPTPVEKKNSSELANIFREKINKDLIQDSEYRDNISALKQKDSVSLNCDRSESVDLNNDRSAEYIIFPYWFCGDIRGAQGNGPIYIFQKINGEWKVIGRLDGNIINIEPKKTSGYYDIITFWHIGADSAVVNSYQWQESIFGYKLKESKETELGL